MTKVTQWDYRQVNRACAASDEHECVPLRVSIPDCRLLDRSASLVPKWSVCGCTCACQITQDGRCADAVVLERQIVELGWWEGEYSWARRSQIHTRSLHCASHCYEGSRTSPAQIVARSRTPLIPEGSFEYPHARIATPDALPERHYIPCPTSRGRSPCFALRLPITAASVPHWRMYHSRDPPPTAWIAAWGDHEGE